MYAAKCDEEEKLENGFYEKEMMNKINAIVA